MPNSFLAGMIIAYIGFLVCIIECVKDPIFLNISYVKHIVILSVKGGVNRNHWGGVKGNQ